MTKTPGSRWILTKDSAISLGVVISMIGIAVWTTSSHQVTKHTIDSLQKEVLRLQDTVVEISNNAAAHESKGIDGFVHPEGVISRVDELEKVLNEKMSDRWKKADDFIYMKEFADANQLKMPSHKTIEEMSH